MQQDHRSGASELLPRAVQGLLTALEQAGPDPVSLAPALRGLVAQQPAMGAVHRLASRALEVARATATRGLDDVSARREIREAAAAFASDFEAATRRIVASASEELVPADGFVATHSRSSLVEATLLAAHRLGKRCGALVAESRPLREGEQLAERLAAAGIPVLYATDAAVPGLVRGTAAVLLGADAVLPRSFLNKVGSTSLLLTAREAGLPAHALAQEAKFLPADAALLDLVERDPAQVWSGAPSGVRVLNPTFEEVDLQLVHGVATERTVLPPGEAGAVAAERQLDPELRQTRRNGGSPSGSEHPR